MAMVFEGSCQEFIEIVTQVGEMAAKAVKGKLADLDALDRWEGEGGPCVESV